MAFEAQSRDWCPHSRGDHHHGYTLDSVAPDDVFGLTVANAGAGVPSVLSRGPMLHGLGSGFEQSPGARAARAQGRGLLLTPHFSREAGGRGTPFAATDDSRPGGGG